MPLDAATTPRVFLSYAWEDEGYRSQVKGLAARLRDDGIDARLDAWHLDGLSIPEFMAREVRLADRILVLCSPVYQRKVHAMEDGGKVSGVAWEHILLSSVVWSGIKDRSQIDVALLRGSWAESAPFFLVGMPYVDLTDRATFEARYRILLQRLHGHNESAPEIGQAPSPVDPRSVERLHGTVRHERRTYKNAPLLMIDLSTYYVADFHTSRGELRFRLNTREVPRLVNSFIFLALEGFYDDTIFHRVIPDFVVQGGDPTGTGEGNPGYFIADAFGAGTHIAGVLSLANAGPNTNGSQFFITLASAPWLDRVYSPFGHLESGWETLRAIRQGDFLRSVTVFDVRTRMTSWSEIVKKWEAVQEEAKKRDAGPGKGRES